MRLVMRRAMWPAVRVVCACVLLAFVWAPELGHYRVERRPAVDAPFVHHVSWPVVAEIGHMDLLPRLVPPEQDPVPVARAVLAGHFPPSRFSATPRRLTGYPADFQDGPPTQQLLFAALETENVLLAAYERSGDRAFLERAIARFEQFSAYEQARSYVNDFLWNDHAVAARVSVLARVWAAAHQAGLDDARLGAAVTALAQHTGALLAKPELFTVRTNHGVVQNLALLQLGSLFPDLPERSAWIALATRRLQLQLEFYVSNEGVVLEHSAEYHLFGNELLADALRLYHLTGQPIPPELAAKARASAHVTALLLRPDGTLPALGNTNARTRQHALAFAPDGATPVRAAHEPPPVQAGAQAFPLSGYDIHWAQEAGGPTQYVVAWAKHDGHGHKHADEGSVTMWRGAVDWLTNTGYWPYGAALAEQAYGWTGSNAPHQVEEPFGVPRTAALTMLGAAGPVRALELRRHNADGRDFLRQVIELGPEQLLVLDFSSALAPGGEVLWTFDPRAQASATAFGHAVRMPDGRTLHVAHAGRASATLRHGAAAPFAGWVVVDGQPQPSHALLLRTPPGPLREASLFTFRTPAPGDALALDAGATATAWTVRAGSLLVQRSGAALTVREGAAAPLSLQLAAAPDMTAAQARLRQAYQRAVAAYPPWHDIADYRRKVTLAIVALAALVELGALALRRRAGAAPVVTAAAAILWLACGYWVLAVYLN